MGIIDFVLPIVSALIGGGIVTIFTLPEKKAAAKLDNAEKVINEYIVLMEKYKVELQERDQRIDALQSRIEELEQKSMTERKTRDQRIEELEAQVRDLEAKLHDMEQKRNAKGQFTKRK